jgi:hypothetical protein
VLQHSYWHARCHEFVAQGLMQPYKWLRLPTDAVFIGLGVVLIVLGTGLTLLGDVGKPAPPGGLAGRLTAGSSRGPQKQIAVT